MKSALLLLALSVVAVTYFANFANDLVELGPPLVLLGLGVLLFVSAYLVLNYSVYRITTALGRFRVTWLLLSSVACIFWPSSLIVVIGLGVASRDALAKEGVKCAFLGPDKDLLAELAAQPQVTDLPL